MLPAGRFARGRRPWAGMAMASVTFVALFATACSNATNTVSSGGGAPGVTSTSITVGSIANVTGPLSSDFAPVVAGVKAYFDVVNALGGVDGRKLLLPSGNQKDDQGNQTTDLTVAQELVEQDHVFSIVGVGTPFMGSAHYLASQGVPTFGYQVQTDWDDGPSLFGGYGSVEDYSTVEPGIAWLAGQLGATSVGVIAYGVQQSAAACKAAVAGFQKFGVPVGFSDLSFNFGGDPTADVLQMKAHNVNFMLSCMDASGNIAFARDIQQNGLSMKELWLNGYDRPTLQQYSSLMQNVYVSIQHVPFEAVTAFPGEYPGIEQYLSAMQRYEPSDTYDEVALDGWVSAVQFVQGLEAVGKNVTQKKLVAAINQETAFTGDGVTTPVNWTNAHTSAPPPWCAAYVSVQGSSFVPAFVQPGNGVFVCFGPNGDTPIPPNPGTPGYSGSSSTTTSSP